MTSSTSPAAAGSSTPVGTAGATPSATDRTQGRYEDPDGFLENWVADSGFDANARLDEMGDNRG